MEGRNELVTLNSKELKQVRKQYEILRNEYSGSNQGLQNIIEELKHQLIIKDMEHQVINERQMGIIKCKDLEIQNNILELKYKGLEIQHKDLQLQMSSRVL